MTPQIDYYMDAEGLRYVDGWGKFGHELLLTEIFYNEHDFNEEVSLDGWGWYGLLKFPKKGHWKTGWPESWRLKNSVSQGEMKFLKSQAGVIIHERDDGGMDVEYFDLVEEDRMHQVWKAIVKDMDEAMKSYCDLERCPGHYEGDWICEIESLNDYLERNFGWFSQRSSHGEMNILVPIIALQATEETSDVMNGFLCEGKHIDRIPADSYIYLTFEGDKSWSYYLYSCRTCSDAAVSQAEQYDVTVSWYHPYDGCMMCSNDDRR